MNGLRDLGDQLKAKIGEGVIVLISDCDGKVNMVAMATQGAMDKGAHAGNLIKGIAALVGGGGGGWNSAGGNGGSGVIIIRKAKNFTLTGRYSGRHCKM